MSIVLGLITIALVGVCGATSVNEIKSMPGFDGEVPFKQYSGFVTVELPDTDFFFWHVESQRSPENDPLLFWFQGGPGCSSLMSLFMETGPWWVQQGDFVTHGNASETKVVLRPVTWNNWANIVYVESPCGVGFSHRGPYETCSSNDTISAVHNSEFIDGFLDAFPHFKGRETWLTGESYAGVYLPSMAAHMIERKTTGAKQLTGIMAGNPVFNCGAGIGPQIAMFYGHSMISQSAWERVVQSRCALDSTTATSSYSECYEEFLEAQAEAGPYIQNSFGWESWFGDVPSYDPDDVFLDFTSGNATLDFILSIPEDNMLGDGAFVELYMNRPDVQAALGIDPFVGWAICNPELFYVMEGKSMIPHWLYIAETRPDISILIYSGDLDVATVPTALTQTCLTQMNATSVKPWLPYTIRGTTAGYVEVFDTYQIATVKGAGHEVPHFQPFIASTMAQRFVESQDLQEPFDDELQARRAEVRRRKTLTQGDVLRMRLARQQQQQ